MKNRLKERYGKLSNLFSLNIDRSFSRLYLKFIGLVHIVALIFLIRSSLNAYIMMLAILLLLMHGCHAVGDIINVPLPVLIHHDGVWKIGQNDEMAILSEIRILFQCHWFVVIGYRNGTRSDKMLICRDQVSPAQYHALLVALNLASKAGI